MKTFLLISAFLFAGISLADDFSVLNAKIDGKFKPLTTKRIRHFDSSNHTRIFDAILVYNPMLPPPCNITTQNGSYTIKPHDIVKTFGIKNGFLVFGKIVKPLNPVLGNTSRFLDIECYACQEKNVRNWVFMMSKNYTGSRYTCVRSDIYLTNINEENYNLEFESKRSGDAED